MKTANNDFVEVEPGSLSGNVSQDTTGDGLGDTPIELVTLSLFDAAGNPVTDGNSDPVTTTTDGSGNYSFNNLTPGDYTVVETQPAGLFNVSEDEGGIDDDQPDNNTINSIAATVNPGENDANNDFVEVEPGSLSGNVSQDTTGDGLGDTPIELVTLSLFDAAGNPVTDGNGDPVTTTTDGSGNYSFNNLTPGDYTVVETQPDGLFNVSEDEGGIDDDQPDDGVVNSIAATVNPGENDAGNDFVEVELGSLSGNVSQDTTGDGLGDTPIPEVTLSLLDGAGNPVTDGNGDPVTTTTDTAGNYQFTNLTPGDYTVVETQPAGLFNVSEDEGGIDDDQPDDGELNSIAATVNPGENDANNDFVEVEPGSLSGNVSQDTTGDGNGDTPIENVELSLLDAAGDPVTDGNGDAVTTTTDTDGNYSFNNLTPGDYTVVETQPDGLFNVSENEGGADDDQPDDGELNSIAATVNPGENDANNDFVEVEPGSLSGNVSQDTTGDGLGDTPIELVTLSLFDAAGNPVTDGNGDPVTTTTDGSGNYSFNNLTPGDYTVVETQPAGLFNVSEDEGGIDDDQPDDGVVNSIAATVNPGENDAGNDFVEVELGSLSGNVSQDTTGDGLGDTPIPEVTLSLLDGAGNPVTDGNGDPVTTTTDTAGNYQFTNLTPGDYTVVETQPDGLFNVSENEGGADDDQPDDGELNSIAATVNPGENDAGNDFVEVEPGSLSGNVSQDTTGDGLGDTPIELVTLSLFDAAGNPVTDGNGDPVTTTTDGSGNYSFNNLTPGDYTVVETQPAGLFNVSEDEGGIDDDQPDDGELNSIAATVNPGENDANNDFVEVEPGSLSGNVSQDTTGDGLGDTPIELVTLSLFDAAGNPVTDGNGDPVTTTTDGSGNYSFNNLTPGDYTVVETQPAGLFNVSEDEGGIDDDQPDNNTINSIAATVNPGENDAGNDFVEVEPGSLSGNVSQDTTGDGAGDTPIPEVTLSLCSMERVILSLMAMATLLPLLLILLVTTNSPT